MSDHEARARELLLPHVSAYYSATAGSGGGSAEGIAAWSAVRFRPRALVDLSTIDTTTTVLGTPVSMPVLVAPMAQQLAAHPEGEVAMARAAATASTLLGVSTNAAVPFADIAATGAPWWFQVYVTRDHRLTELMVQRAVDAGARALVLTVDMLALLPPDVNPRSWPESPGRYRMTNLTPAELAAADPHAIEMDPAISCDTVGWLHQISGLPVLVKGVLRGDDAARAVDAGAAGVVVSTHGGRRLGPSVPAAVALPEVVAAIGADAEVYADSGIRSAEHVAAAVALGARAVFVGRPALWALAAEGENGVRDVLTGLQTELQQVMTQLGAPRIDDLTPDLVVGALGTGALRPGGLVSGCPVRKLEPDGRVAGPSLAHVKDAAGDRWVVRSFGVARQVLRDPEATSQAGFGAEHGANDSGRRGRAAGPSMRPPILYLEGPQHRSQRSATARFFAPKVVEGYRPMMESVSEELVGRLRPDRDLDLRDLAMELAVQVVARVVGLTDSSTRGMSRRLDTFFSGDLLGKVRGPVGLLRKLRSGTALARFYYLDVKPAIRSRRRRPQEDVISQLLADGFSDLEILTECLTYGAAGMATTRELICMAAWHLLDDPELLARYRAGGSDERASLLSETLRLEPVVGHLYRRLRQPLVLDVDGQAQELPSGSLVDLDLRAVNADAATVGEEPYGLCPGRDLPRTVPAAVMGFGDGHHRCPGGPLAILETEIFLTALLAHDVVAAGPPRVRWNPVSQGYDLDQFHVRAAA